MNPSAGGSFYTMVDKIPLCPQDVLGGENKQQELSGERTPIVLSEDRQ